MDLSPADSATAAPGGTSASERIPDRRALRLGGLVGGVAVLATAAVVAVDPTDSGVPICASRAVFGFDCPLCGGLRATNMLARGDWLAAADHNVLVAVGLPLVLVGWVLFMVSAWRGRRVSPPAPSRWALTGIVVALLAFTVVRNIDAGPVSQWLAASLSA